MAYITTKQVEVLISKLAPSEDHAYLASEWANLTYGGLDAKQSSVLWKHVEGGIYVILHSKADADKQGLSNMADEYLSRHQWLRTEEIDWMLCNAIVYAETKATLNVFLPMWMQADSAWKYAALAFKAIFFCLMWALWLALAIVLYEHGLLWAIFFLILTATYQTIAFAKRKKRAELISSMLSAYEMIATPNTSWGEFFRSLVEAKNLGAVWPAVVFRIAETRSKY